MMRPESIIPPLEPSAKPVASGMQLTDSPAEPLHVLIAQQPFFKGLSSPHIQRLAESALIMNFAPGQAIFAEGSPANRFYLILEGRVVLESELNERGNRIALQTLGPGDALGWSWLFPPYSLHQSAHAQAPTRTIFFFGPQLREQCEQDHELGYQLMRRIAEVATQCLQATQRLLVESIGTNQPPQN